MLVPVRLWFLGVMGQEPFDELDRIWTLHPSPEAGAAADDAPALTIETLGPITPLDAQFGVAAPLTVPETLGPAMFGQTGEQPHNTYALIDAARVMHLLETLQDSRLEAQCLFKGRALDELGTVAPWVVRLEKGNAFARSLFTDTDAGGDRWAEEPAIYLRSPLDIGDVVGQLRRFTRLQASDGRWHYFRFWEPFHYHVLAARRPAFPELEALWRRVFAGCDVLVPQVATASMLRLRVPPGEVKRKLGLTDALRAELKLAVLYRNMMGAAADLYELHPEPMARYGSAPPEAWPWFFDFADEVRRVGLTDPELRGRVMLLAFLTFPRPFPAFLELPFWQRIRQSPGQANDLVEDFCARLKYLSQQGRTEFEVWW